MIESIEKPTYWYTNQNLYDQNIYRKEEANEIWLEFYVDYPVGGYACNGLILQKFSKAELPPLEGLTFTIRSQSLNQDSSVFFRVDFVHYNAGETIEVETTIIDTIVSEWTTMTLPIKHVVTDSLWLRILGGGVLAATDGCLGLSRIELDNVDFLFKTETQEFEQQRFVLFPNPATNSITIKRGFSENDSYNIINAEGQIVLSSITEKCIDVGSLYPGRYYLISRANVLASFIKL